LLRWLYCRWLETRGLCCNGRYIVI